MNRHYKESGWYHYLEHSMRDLVDQSVILLERERGFKKIVFHDYSYVVFPAAKAYEGFIKQFLLDSGLLIASQYESRHFRIGKSLNPDLPERYRDEEWIYGRLEEKCDDRGIPRLGGKMWETWRVGRNLLFHYFPYHENFINLDKAEALLERIFEMMETAYESGIIEK